MSKVKMSMTIDEEVVQMLRTAAATEGISESAMAERAIRQTCTAYVPHRLEVDLLEQDRVSVTVERQGRMIYRRRGVERDKFAHVVGTLTLDVPGRVEPHALSRAIRKLPVTADSLPYPGSPIAWSVGALSVELSNITLGADVAAVRVLLLRAAQAVSWLEHTALHDVMKLKCPECGMPIATLLEWAPPDQPETREVTCMLGHKSGT